MQVARSTLGAEGSLKRERCRSTVGVDCGGTCTGGARFRGSLEGDAGPRHQGV